MLNAELQTLRDRLAKIPLDALKNRLEKAEQNSDLLSLVAFAANPRADERQAFAVAQNELITARNQHISAESESRKLGWRIAEIERILSADRAIEEAHAQLENLRATSLTVQSDIDLTDAALAKLVTMKAEADERLAGFADNTSEQLLIDAGLPGIAATQPKSAEVAKTQQEITSLAIAIAKAQTQHNSHTKALANTAREIRTVQATLLVATADKLAVDHADALGRYLPFLAAMRGAEVAAHGHTVSAEVDVEKLAQAMNQAASA